MRICICTNSKPRINAPSNIRKMRHDVFRLYVCVCVCVCAGVCVCERERAMICIISLFVSLSKRAYILSGLSFSLSERAT